MEEIFYYNRRKCFSHGAFFTIIVLWINPFSWLIHDGLAGVMMFCLFLPPLVRGLNHILKSLLPIPALKLTPAYLEMDTFYFGRQQVSWADIQDIRYGRAKGGARLRVVGIPVHLPFLLGPNYVVLLFRNGGKMEMNLDALKLDGRDLEALLRDYKRTYFYQPEEENIS